MEHSHDAGGYNVLIQPIQTIQRPYILDMAEVPMDELGKLANRSGD
jgi:hypothetical protein